MEFPLSRHNQLYIFNYYKESSAQLATPPTGACHDVQRSLYYQSGWLEPKALWNSPKTESFSLVRPFLKAKSRLIYTNYSGTLKAPDGFWASFCVDPLPLKRYLIMFERVSFTHWLFFWGEQDKMPVPKFRTSASKRNMRRSHHALKSPGLSVCPNCGETKRPQKFSKVREARN